VFGDRCTGPSSPAHQLPTRGLNEVVPLVWWLAAGCGAEASFHLSTPKNIARVCGSDPARPHQPNPGSRGTRAHARHGACVASSAVSGGQPVSASAAGAGCPAPVWPAAQRLLIEALIKVPAIEVERPGIAQHPPRHFVGMSRSAHRSGFRAVSLASSLELGL